MSQSSTPFLLASHGVLVLTIVSTAPGCAADLGPSFDHSADDDHDTSHVSETEDGALGGPEVQHEDQGDRLRTHVDATDPERWIWLDLETGEQLTVGDALSDGRWDLGFSRFNVRINGGVSGNAGMEATYVDDTTLERVMSPPVDGWMTDVLDEDENVAHAFDEWYDYDLSTHVLTPWPRVYLVRTGDGNFFKIAIVGYYSEAGSSGHMQFEWADLPVGDQ